MRIRLFYLCLTTIALIGLIFRRCCLRRLPILDCWVRENGPIKFSMPLLQRGYCLVKGIFGVFMPLRVSTSGLLLRKRSRFPSLRGYAVIFPAPMGHRCVLGKGLFLVNAPFSVRLMSHFRFIRNVGQCLFITDGAWKGVRTFAAGFSPFKGRGRNDAKAHPGVD